MTEKQFRCTHETAYENYAAVCEFLGVESIPAFNRSSDDLLFKKGNVFIEHSDGTLVIFGYFETGDINHHFTLHIYRYKEEFRGPHRCYYTKSSSFEVVGECFDNKAIQRLFGGES